MSTVIPDGLSIEQLMEIRDSFDEQIRDMAAKPKVASKTKAKAKNAKVKSKSKVSKKQARKAAEKQAEEELELLKEARKQARKDLQKAKKDRKKAKAKAARKAKKAKAKAKARKGWGRVKRGARRARKSTGNFGRRMWKRAVGAAKWVWDKTKWVGRKIAAGGAWLIAGGTRVAQWAISGLGWGWIIVGAAGVIILTLVGWGVSSGSEALVAPLSWLAKGRPGSLKKYKAKRNAKRKAQSQKALQKRANRLGKETKRAQKAADKARTKSQRKAAAKQAVAEKRVRKAAAKKAAATRKANAKKAEVAPKPVKSKTSTKAPAKHKATKKVVAKSETSQSAAKKAPAKAEVKPRPPKTAAFKTEAEKAETNPELKAQIERDEYLVAKAAAMDYTDLKDEEIVEALGLRQDALKDAQVPKDAYSRIAGRFNTARYIITDQGPLRGKPLYDELKAELLKGYGGEDATSEQRLKLARMEIDLGKFQMGIVEEQKLLADRFPVSAAS